MEWSNIIQSWSYGHQSIQAQMCLLVKLEVACLKFWTLNIVLYQFGLARWFFVQLNRLSVFIYVSLNRPHPDVFDVVVMFCQHIRRRCHWPVKICDHWSTWPRWCVPMLLMMEIRMLQSLTYFHCELSLAVCCVKPNDERVCHIFLVMLILSTS